MFTGLAYPVTVDATLNRFYRNGIAMIKAYKKVDELKTQVTKAKRIK